MSEPLAKLPSISGILQPYGEDDRIEFYLTLCFDVILEVLQFGDRRRLTKLEGVGRRFHHLVEKLFGEMPFLRLDIKLLCCRERLEAFIGRDRIEDDETKISLAKLAEFPPFLRFNNARLYLYYYIGSQPLLAKCLLFEGCLNSVKPALKDSNKIRFHAVIEQADPNDINPFHFIDPSTVVIYLRDRLLPICDSTRRYAFDISFESADENSATEVISTILQIPQVQSCSNVSIVLFDYRYVSARLPVEDISNWLAPKPDDGVLYGKRKENRFLKIKSYFIPNTQEMWEHLKEKFDEDECPAIPFTLRIEDDEDIGYHVIIKEQKLSNRKTNEELSISPNIEYEVYKGTEIKRTVKQRKNSQPKA